MFVTIRDRTCFVNFLSSKSGSSTSIGLTGVHQESHDLLSKWSKGILAGANLLLIYLSGSGGATWVRSPSFLPFPSSLSSSIFSIRMKIISNKEMKSAAKPHQPPVFPPAYCQQNLSPEQTQNISAS